MKTTLPLFTVLTTCSVLTLLSAGARAQSTGGDAGWNAQFAALDEERNAQVGVAVSIVFDDSGSMAEHNKMPMAKQAFQTWIAGAPESYRFGLVALNAGPLVTLKRNNKAEILAAVNRLRPSGDTPLADTIAKVDGAIRQRRAAGALYERQVAVILTDGEDNSKRGISGVQDEINRLRADRVEVIAFGYQHEGGYMRGCATHFFSPDNEQDIQRGLNAVGSEIGDTADVVVDDATRAKMQAMTPTAAAVAAANPDRAASQPAQPAQTPPRSVARPQSHWLFKTMLIVIAVYFLFGRRRRK